MTPGADRIALVPPPDPAVAAALATVLPGLRERGWEAEVLDAAAPSRRRPRRADGFAARLRARAPRIVHFLGADIARPLVGSAVAVGARTAVTFSAGEASVTGLEVADYYRPVWEGASALHFPDEAVARRALGRGCPPETPRAVIAPFLVDDAFSANGSAAAGERPLRVLCAGELEWTGGYEHGLQGLARAREAGVAAEGRVVGVGAHLPALLFARHQLGLGEAVEFIDGGSAEALREHLEWADVFLAPTVIDGLPGGAGEAAAMGVCLILGDLGPVGELAPGEAAAVTVPRRDPGAVAEALAALAADPARRERMGAGAREWARARLTVAAHLDGLDDLYRRALA